MIELNKDQQVYIKGNSKRASEIIGVLKSLGGRTENTSYYNVNDYSVYFIDHSLNIYWAEKGTELYYFITNYYREYKLPVPEWTDGDILIDTNSDEPHFVIFDKYTDYEMTEMDISCDLTNESVCYTNNELSIDSVKTKNFKKADEQEKSLFNYILHKHGKDWSQENGKICDWNWTPKKGEEYYYLSTHICFDKSTDNLKDSERIKSGNCFKSSVEAEFALRELKTAFLKNYSK